MSVRIDVVGDDDALDDLLDWLRDDRDLRGRYRRESAPVRPGTMGSGTEIVMDLSNLVESGSALVSSVVAWLAYRKTLGRRTTPTVTFTAPDGGRVEITADRTADLESLIASVSGQAHRDDGPAT
ncbi:hypothetical protein ABZX77_03760 [Streptomyces sp. NPDC004237]|uniref:effector-associated constant component EACC1 n=1 Tax=Streptomyces sp. NPDC004237 TaxID=3154455 RepID=UPI00339E544A